jgi:lauroyl/myristoyl acyltransferase/ADP-heptose:LPS heptosyltransferase
MEWTHAADFVFLIPNGERHTTLYRTLVILGYLLAHTPRGIVRVLCVIFGNIAMLVQPHRRRLVLSNLHHSFPEKGPAWCKKICRENFYRLIELGMLSMASGFFSAKKISSNFKVPEQYRKIFRRIANDGRGAIFLVPHVTSMEAMTFLLDIVAGDVGTPEVGVIYRQFANEQVEKFIKSTREKRGMKLISRKSGIFEAIRILKNNGLVALLFDQNAGDGGNMMPFFGRIISSTNLPCILHKKFKVPVYFLYPRRVGVWRANVLLKELKFDGNNPETILFAANKYLELLLSGSDGACADWLWAHDRWKVAASCSMNLSEDSGKNWTRKFRDYFDWQPKIINARVMVRMPNWLGDVVMAIPALRMLKSSRSDIEIIFACKRQFSEFLKNTGIPDRIVELPDARLSYFFNLSPVIDAYPDVYISLVNSLRGDLEAILVNAPKRIGIDTKNRDYRKFFINNLYRSREAGSVHQTRLWQSMLREFGFGGTENFSPFKFCSNAGKPSKYRYSIGVICGSIHEPRKRWPHESWKILIEKIFEKYSGAHINLYGAKSDAIIVDDVAALFSRATISNFAGATSLLELVERMQTDDLIISIDSGGMHVANMFGRPLICLYGMTNSVATGPVFESPSVILMPESCPQKGGFPTEDISTETVFRAVRHALQGGPPMYLECAKRLGQQ